MILVIRQAATLDIVTLRQEHTRAKRITLWRRLNLDYLLILLLIAGYVVYSYLWQQIVTSQNGDPLLYNVAQGLAFVTPVLLTTALLMLFLRIFPNILHRLASLSARGRSTAAVMAFAHMERSPRAAVRIIVLLTLTIAASCFLLTLIATKDQRTSDAASFAVGADFSGRNINYGYTNNQYGQVPGVQSATLGCYTIIATNTGTTNIVAVDAGTYAQTVNWMQQESSQSLKYFTDQLITYRTDATTNNVVYALVDSSMWQKYHLAAGERFSTQVDDANSVHISFVALAEITNLPGIYDTPINIANGAGMLVDYQSYAIVYKKESGKSLAPNMVWLRTKDDAASLASVRQAFPDLADRRQLTSSNQMNSIHLDIIGILVIGIGAILVLALIGTLLLSWLNAASRRTSFAVMRALGMVPQQIAAVLLWEQVFIYATGFISGIGLGTLLTIFVAPVIGLLDIAGPDGPNNPFDVPVVLTVVPYAQLYLLVGFIVVICLGALLLMSRIVSRPSIGLTLRLNED